MMGESRKVTGVSVTIDGQPFSVGTPLEAGHTVAIEYTINRGEGDKHVRLLGTVDDRRTDQVRLTSIEDLNSGDKATIGSAVLVDERLNDPAKLSEALSARNYDVLLGIELHELNWSDIDFPSDHLSIKRLRTMFPKKFDDGTVISAGGDKFGGCLFFHPAGDEDSAHLTRLNDLLDHERTIADFAFFKAFDSVDDFCREEHGKAKEALVALYLEFKLAESPETARLLIQQLDEQGAHQAKQITSHAR